jgi:hypothetical protein
LSRPSLLSFQFLRGGIGSHRHCDSAYSACSEDYQRSALPSLCLRTVDSSEACGDWKRFGCCCFHCDGSCFTGAATARVAARVVRFFLCVLFCVNAACHRGIAGALVDVCSCTVCFSKVSIPSQVQIHQGPHLFKGRVDSVGRHGHNHPPEGLCHNE